MADDPEAAVVRLSRPQTTLTGAQDGDREALVGVDVRRDEERRARATAPSCRPGTRRIVSDMPYGRPALVVEQRLLALAVPDAHVEVAATSRSRCGRAWP